MRVESIHLKHTLHFSDIKLNFQYHDLPITLILGAQGSGKTTLLRFTYQALTWFAARYKDIRTAGVVMLDQDVMQTRLQSKIDISVRFPDEVGRVAESSNNIAMDTQTCSWQLYKTLNHRGVGMSKVDTQQLETLIGLYQQAQHNDPHIGLPLIAYYPADRFVNEMNLISKNNPVVLQSSNAYDICAIPFTTYARFFEWLREVTDLENAQTTHMLQQILKQHRIDEEFFFSQKLAQSYAQMSAPALKALNHALHIVLPDIQHLYLEYHPKLQLMVHYQEKDMLFQQLSNSVRNTIALVGDIVRRLCLLNPRSLYPCLEGDGVLLIDAIDHQLDTDLSAVILQRLHKAFPRLQIIATGSRHALLENAEGFQCLKLENKKLFPLLQPQIEFQHMYEQLGLPATEDDTNTLVENNASAEQFFHQIQNQLSPEQQQVLVQMLQQDGHIQPNFQSE